MTTTHIIQTFLAEFDNRAEGIRSRAARLLPEARSLTDSGHQAGDHILTHHAAYAAAILDRADLTAALLDDAEAHLDKARRRREELAGWYYHPNATTTLDYFNHNQHGI